MMVKHPECDLRSWLSDHTGVVSDYSHARIIKSYDAIYKMLLPLKDMVYHNAYDVGCGSGFDSFALGTVFDHVVAADTNKQAIDEARLITSRAGLTSISFEHVDVVKYKPQSKCDLVFCNLMSHNVASRIALLKQIEGCMQDGGYLLYAELTEGYGPMEIHRAVREKDQAKLVSYLDQVLCGFSECKKFRFYESGSIKKLLSSLGFSILDHHVEYWNGLVISEKIVCRKGLSRSATSLQTIDDDYVNISEDFNEIKSHFNKAISLRKSYGYTENQKTAIMELIQSIDNRFSPFLLFLLMDDVVLPGFKRRASYLSRIRRRVSRQFGIWKVNVNLDWSFLKKIDSRFISTVRQKAKLEAEQHDD